MIHRAQCLLNIWIEIILFLDKWRAKEAQALYGAYTE